MHGTTSVCLQSRCSGSRGNAVHVLVVLVMSVVSLWADTIDILPEWIGESVVVRLRSGDMLEGILLGQTLRDSADAIRLRTSVGTATIELYQVAEIVPLPELYRHAWQLLLMPTAEPIGKNHCLMSMGLLTLGAAGGLGDIASILVLRSIVPALPSSHQVSLLNAKVTLLTAEYQQLDGHLALCVGANLAWVNAPNRLAHLWAAATFTRVQSRLTLLVMQNLSNQESYTVTVGTFGSVIMRYAPAAVGFGLGLDVQLPSRRDVHILAELWNLDLTRPYQSMVVFGLRLANTALALDAGIAMSTQPLLLPIASVRWTPW